MLPIDQGLATQQLHLPPRGIIHGDREAYLSRPTSHPPLSLGPDMETLEGKLPSPHTTHLASGETRENGQRDVGKFQFT